MFESTELLWSLCHEYGQRLAQAYSYVELLEHLLVERAATPPQDSLLIQLGESRLFLNDLRGEFRTWRYTFFYQTPDSRRMVSTKSDVEMALDHFRDMRTRHLELLIQFSEFFQELPRPRAEITNVPTGDLWDKVISALMGLIDFDRNGVTH
ncbi:MAG: hypothetical protein IPK19_29025 [Chloroflexi bacterium]|nr:hypothetical protein [Chloroflexota bacterium]